MGEWETGILGFRRLRNASREARAAYALQEAPIEGNLRLSCPLPTPYMLS